MTAGGAVILAGTGFLLAFTLPDHSMFLAYWLPLGVLAGIGMAALSMGVERWQLDRQYAEQRAQMEGLLREALPGRPAEVRVYRCPQVGEGWSW